MKKVLLVGAILALGTVANAAKQTNGIIVPVISGQTAVATLSVDVSGKVFNSKGTSLVVEPISAGTPDGTGFSLIIKNLFTKSTNNPLGSEGKSEGSFTAKVMVDGLVVPLSAAAKLEANLIYAGTVATDNQAKGVKVQGTADDTTLDYVLSGVMNKTTNVHEGNLVVFAHANTKTGEFSDNLAKVSVTLSGQTAVTPGA